MKLNKKTQKTQTRNLKTTELANVIGGAVRVPPPPPAPRPDREGSDL